LAANFDFYRLLPADKIYRNYTERRGNNVEETMDAARAVAHCDIGH